MAVRTETIQLNGIRCERCVTRLTLVLKDHPGLDYAHGNLMGQLTVSYDDEQTTRGDLLAAVLRGGFHEVPMPPDDAF